MIFAIYFKNDLELLSQNKVDAPQEQTPPKVDQTTLQIQQEQQKAKIILDEIFYYNNLIVCGNLQIFNYKSKNYFSHH